VLAGWQWWAADPPGVPRPWEPGETLPDGVRDIWCRPAADQPWRIQLMLDESRGDDWISRRNSCVRRPISALGQISADGIPCLAPEIHCSTKRKHPGRKTRPISWPRFHLDSGQRQWLMNAITDTHGTHPWLSRLRS
jgi:hypothetical protein